MPILNIKDMKVVSPSPENFILDLEISSDIDKSGHHYKYIASGEHIFQNSDGTIDDELLNEHVAHSSIFKIGEDSFITAFNLFDMNDMAITTSYDGEDQIDNILTMPNSNDKPKDRKSKPIEIHTINSNSAYGYMPTEKNKSFGYPVYDKVLKKFIMSTHNSSASLPDSKTELGTTDTLTLYHYRKNATNISGVLGLGHQADIDRSQIGFDKMFVFDPTDDNVNGFKTDDLISWRYGWQSNDPDSPYNRTRNNFDDGMLLARAILFPKQTLNNEYSTEREYLEENTDEKKYPFHYARSYKWTDPYFYSNGTHIVLNHRDSNKFNFLSEIEDVTNTNDRVGGTMVTSTYSRRFTEAAPIYHETPEPPIPSSYVLKKEDGKTTIPKTDYNTYGTITFEDSKIENDEGLFNQYSPELINRENETQSDTTLMTSKHKTNIFDIEFKSLWDSIVNEFDKIQKTDSTTDISAYTEIKSNLKSTIKNNLFKLVEEIKPAHTKLYKVEMGNN